jgi:sugar-specific transcriptional regulator TrmB
MQAEQIQVDKNEKKKSELLDDELELLPVYTRDTSRTRIPSEAVDHLSALKRIDKALSKFKFSKNEVRVYLYLARFGAHKAQSIAESLDVHRTEAYKILRRLESQGLISRVMERPMKFVAVPFETVLSQLIEERRQRVHQLEKKKTELLKIWASLPEPDNVQETKETFQVLEGKRHISVRLNELLESCKVSLDLVVSDINLIWLYNTPFLDDLVEVCDEQGIRVRLLTNYTQSSSFVFDRTDMGQADFAYLKKYEMPGYFIRDGEEVVLLMSNDQSNIYGMWTNYSSIVDSYKILFDLLWRNK